MTRRVPRDGGRKRREANAQKAPAPSAERSPGRQEGKLEGRPRAVVVEDEFVVSLFLRDMLESLGWEVAANVADAASAVELARSLRPQVVLMDLRLAEGDALEATRTITSETGSQVIVVTAVEGGEARAARAAGALCVLSKPVQEAQLAAALSQALRAGEGP